MKSVSNLISYLYELLKNFSQFLAICFELFSFGVIFNSEITYELGRASAAHAGRAALCIWAERSFGPVAPG
jgi:hypothetical protein